MGTVMSKMKDYYEFLQMLYRLDTDALRVMLEYECDDFRRQLIEGEIGARAWKAIRNDIKKKRVVVLP